MKCCNNPNIITVPAKYDPRHCWYDRCLNCGEVRSVRGCDGVANENWANELFDGIKRYLESHKEEVL